MFNKFSSGMVAVACISFMVMVAGCAISGSVKPAEKMAPPPAEVALSDGWWSASFRMHWAADQPADWHWDLFIAHKIVAPVLMQYRDEIQLWRFHRRATRDGAGHQFSFTFYASAEMAYKIFSAVRANELLKEMKNAGVIIKDLYDNTDKINQPRIEDGSDARWPPVVQKTWPFFIMGASQMWLNLISETVTDMPNSDSTLSLIEYERLYQKVNAAISELWEAEGQHAFLHHLSALFGYRPIIFYDRRMLKF